MESRYLQNLSLKEGHVVCYGGPVVLKHDYFSNECSVNMSNTYPLMTQTTVNKNAFVPTYVIDCFPVGCMDVRTTKYKTLLKYVTDCLQKYVDCSNKSKNCIALSMTKTFKFVYNCY